MTQYPMCGINPGVMVTLEPLLEEALTTLKAVAEVSELPWHEPLVPNETTLTWLGNSRGPCGPLPFVMAVEELWDEASGDLVEYVTHSLIGVLDDSAGHIWPPVEGYRRFLKLNGWLP